MNISNYLMKLRGYEKVLLNDQKGVLNESNNYKWVKNKTKVLNNATQTTTKEIFKRGTKVETKQGLFFSTKNNDGVGEYYNKIVKKPDGTIFYYNGKYTTISKLNGKCDSIRS